MQKIKLTCPVCSKDFERYPSQMVKGGETCCSRKCGYKNRIGKRISPRGIKAPDSILASEYQSGLTLKQVGKLHGVTGEAIYYRLKTAGIKLRPRKSPFSDPALRARFDAKRRAHILRGKDHPSYKDLPIDDIHSLYDSGMPTTQIALKYGVQSYVIANRLKAIGVTMRPHGRGKMQTCFDGHVAQSRAEYLVDEWLTSNHIPHEIHPHVPWSSFQRADFLVGDTFIEVWGIERRPEYEERKSAKLKEYRAHGLRLISLTSKQLLDGDYSPLATLLSHPE